MYMYLPIYLSDGCESDERRDVANLECERFVKREDFERAHEVQTRRPRFEIFTFFVGESGAGVMSHRAKRRGAARRFQL